MINGNRAGGKLLFQMGQNHGGLDDGNLDHSFQALALFRAQLQADGGLKIQKKTNLCHQKKLEELQNFR